MSGARGRDSLANLERAVARLGEALAEPATNPLVVDATIQRFEFVIGEPSGARRGAPTRLCRGGCPR